MFDGLSISTCDANTKQRLLAKLPLLKMNIDKATGEILYYYTNVEHIYVKIFEGVSNRVNLDGSLHRFYKGNNDTLFSFQEVDAAVVKFCYDFEVRQDQPLYALELGMNINVKCPPAIIDAAVLYGTKTATTTKKNKGHYYKEWEFADYIIKLYQKGPNILRYEVKIKRMRKLNQLGVNVHTLADLRNIKLFHDCIIALHQSIDKFVFVPGRISSLPEELHGEWAKYRSDDWWGEVTEKHERDKIRKRISQLIIAYKLINWKTYFQNQIIEIGKLMIGGECMAPTFSTLGLETETVAAGGRPINEKKGITFFLLLQSKDFYLVVRNTITESFVYHSRSEHISFHLGGRSPPSISYLIVF